MKAVSMRGEVVDVSRYLAQNEKQVALGNAGLNARGDMVGRGGKIIKAREVIAAEYHRANPKAVRHVSLKDMAADEAIMSPAEAVAKVLADRKAEQTPEAAPAPRKRRISEAD